MEVVSVKTNEEALTYCAYVSDNRFPFKLELTDPTGMKKLVVSTRLNGELEPNQIALNSGYRAFLYVELKKVINVKTYNEPLKFASSVLIDIQPYKFQNKSLIEDTQKIKDELIARNVVYNVGTTLLIKSNSLDYKITFNISDCNPFAIGENTKIIFIGAIANAPKRLLKLDSINFTQLGVGGLEAQFEEIFRRVFLPRMIPESLRERLGIVPARGILLWGIPGGGKTSLARQIASMAECQYRIVNGPEFLDKYVGEAERKIRELFEPAIKNPKEIYVIIMDEIDSLCKARGSSTHGDTIVNQLLTKIDGVEAIPNVIIIGMTNRKDLIDPALLRPGRLEVQVEIGLPDVQGRYQILKIHTNKIEQSGLLGNDVDLNELALLTKNYTGAELEAVVKGAVTVSLRQEIDIKNLETIGKIKNVMITDEHFKTALQDVPPMFGDNRMEIDRIITPKTISFEYQEEIRDQCLNIINKHLSNIYKKTLSLIIDGKNKSGKTTILALIAKAISDKIPFVRYIPSDFFLCKSESEKATKIHDIFLESYKSKSAMIIFDDLDIILECSSDHIRYSNNILQTFLMLLSKHIPNEKLIILFSISNIETVFQLGLDKRVDKIIDIGDDGNTILLESIL